MIQVFIDPSYTGTGVVTYDTDLREFRCAVLRSRGKEALRSYLGYYGAAKVSARLLGLFMAMLPKGSEVVLEIPPPIGQTSAGLTGLGFLLLSEIDGSGYDLELLNPVVVSNWQKKFFHKDFDRRSIVKKIVERMRESSDPFKIVDEDLLYSDNDVATAFLFFFIKRMFKAGLANMNLIKFNI